MGLCFILPPFLQNFCQIAVTFHVFYSPRASVLPLMQQAKCKKLLRLMTRFLLTLDACVDRPLVTGFAGGPFHVKEASISSLIS